MTAPTAFLVTCEHGGNHVPPKYRSWFRGWRRWLESHRGFDPGALDMARYLARRLGAPLEYATTTRLLVDLNRTPPNRRIFSDAVPRDPVVREEILRRLYFPHRERVEKRIESMIANGARVLHIASHSFTPVLDGEQRRADVAWLYDPSRSSENGFCGRCRDELGKRRPDLRVRRNYPYRGSADGLTTYLRTKFPARHYVGVELEVNQRWFRGERRRWLELKRSLADAVASVAWIS